MSSSSLQRTQLKQELSAFGKYSSIWEYIKLLNHFWMIRKTIELYLVWIKFKLEYCFLQIQISIYQKTHFSTGGAVTPLIPAHPLSCQSHPSALDLTPHWPSLASLPHPQTPRPTVQRLQAGELWREVASVGVITPPETSCLAQSLCPSLTPNVKISIML